MVGSPSSQVAFPPPENVGASEEQFALDASETHQMCILMEGVAQCRIDGGNTHYIC
jgi:hypothetical protein